MPISLAINLTSAFEKVRDFFSCKTCQKQHTESTEEFCVRIRIKNYIFGNNNFLQNKKVSRRLFKLVI